MAVFFSTKGEFFHAKKKEKRQKNVTKTSYNVTKTVISEESVNISRFLNVKRSSDLFFNVTTSEIHNVFLTFYNRFVLAGL